MAAGGNYRPGKTIRVTYAVTPRSGGSTSLADIACTQADPNGVVSDLTASVVQEEVNQFYVDITVALPEGDWWVRFTSSPPSVADAEEINYQVLQTHVSV